ncbi:hypothetical protein [Nocardia sp. No.11]|uniref:hypothetical protein n=1 Tax=Nocardia sp. No.11 TaxID=3128861 RepID=UPI00319E581A
MEFMPVTAITVLLNKTLLPAVGDGGSVDCGCRTEYFGWKYWCTPVSVDTFVQPWSVRGVGVITARVARCPVLFPGRSSGVVWQ